MEPMTDRQFWLLVAVSQVLVSIDNPDLDQAHPQGCGGRCGAWELGHRDPQTVVAAWTALATLPLEVRPPAA